MKNKLINKIKSCILGLLLILPACKEEKQEEVKYLLSNPPKVSIEIGDSQKIIIYVIPISVSQEVSYISSDPSVATVENDGTVTGISLGTAFVTAASALDPQQTVDVPVTVEEEQVVVPTGNLAEGKLVKASDYVGTYVPENAVDGKSSTRWVANNTAFSQHWLEIDLQGSYKVSKIVIDGDDAILMSDFRVQAWINSAWTDIVSITDSRRGDYTFSDFTPVTTTKIRYIADDVNYYPSTGEVYNGVRMWEIEVY